ncbi:MAG: acyl transferase domain-containing protein/NADPH:quinone reductase-like Zn-dependent oxidoreductase/acyl-CoA synthetase (AMP-forming) [Myxococcota bacterium]|jgi:acyl transferase domain-containing protein/NADPH:quinone reductase-like Zn-dependent oxidoreductase/acyl-CoA synthetase (AMP-forming)/AMP-acid ligase II/acyl carrier protein
MAPTPTSPYRNLTKTTARINNRSLRYRFDLEADIPWATLPAPGLHLPPALLHATGIHPTIANHPEAHAILQWSIGLEISRAFSALEQYLLDFVDAERTAIGPTRSALLLYEEERKHIAMFDRYGDHLAAQHPEWMPDFEAAFAPCMPALLHPYTRDAYPEPPVQHYFFWLKTLFFEEYTIYLHDRLLAEQECVQPTWLAVHRAHRMEEHQHVITDAAYVDALDLSPTKRQACATAFWIHLEQTFDRFLGVAASRRLIRARFPRLAHLVPDVPTRQLPLFQAVLSHPLFRQTRRCAPGSDRLEAGVTRLTDALDRAAATEQGLTILTERKPDTPLTYAALRRAALGVTDALRRQGVAQGDVVVIPTGKLSETLAVFWGVQLGGMVAVLVDGTTPDRLDGIRAVLPEAHVLTELAGLLAHTPAGPVTITPRSPDDLAIIQFSSGSTGEPRGVRLTHRALLANIDAIIAGLGGRAEDVFVSWLPLSHDMGLIGYHLLPVVLGAAQVLMSTRHFLKRPMDWLVALDRLHGTVTASPDFGLTLTLNRLDHAAVADLDLSGLHCLLCGAETIRPATLTAFAEALAPAGLRPEALTPAYGLAEATLCLTARPPGEPWRTHTLDRATLAPGCIVRQNPDGLALVGVGVPLSRVVLRVVDDSGSEVPAGTVGEIEAQGPGITDGYIGTEARPTDAFRDDWLRTGDLGVMIDGRLVITGRRKALLIVNGQNHYAHDIEAALSGIDGLHPRRVAVLCDPLTETLTIAAVLRDDSLKAAITRRLQERLGITPDRIVAVRSIPRTSSGKIRRGLLSEQLAVDPMQQRVREAWAEALSRPLSEIPKDADFRALGGTSIQAAHVHAILEDALGPLPLSVLMESTTISELAHQLAPHQPTEAPTPEPTPTSDLRPDDIAIIGIGLRLPGADTPEALWSLLREGRHAFRPVPADRWDHARYRNIGGGVGGFLDDIFSIDPAALGLSVAEAAQADPRHRLFLEVAAGAMQDAGIGPGRVGVFVSQGESPENCRSFLDDLARDEPRMAGRLDNSTNNMVAARVSRTFDLTGPAVVIQAACASSLVAVHQARRSLQHGECESAIVGGVELLHSPTLYALFEPTRVLSPTGRCRPFTTDADGFVPGEGAAAVVLKRLDAALRDGDRIRAVIRGSAIGNDGRAFSTMAPNPAGQITVARRALEEAGISADSVSMLEAHGTATPIGDAVELRAMGQVYADASVTTVKSNLGHLLAAAGVAALIKTTLSLEHDTIPPIAGFTTARAESTLRPAAAPVRWPDGVRRAAINALGIGGTNCHVIVEQAPPRPKTPPATASLLCLSAHTDDGLQRQAAQLAGWLPRGADRGAVCHAIGRTARLYPRRIATVVTDLTEARSFLSTPPTPGPKRRLAVLFPGPGALAGGLPSLLSADPVCIAALADCAAVIQAATGARLDDLLADPLARIDTAQPAAFAVSWATWCWLEAMGVRPTAFAGHSAGEYAALAAAGVLTMPEALTALIARGEAMAAAPSGEMAAVFGSAQQVLPHLFGAEIAALNAPRQVVISGRDLTASLAALTQAGITHHRLAIPCAAHSEAMEHAQPALAMALSGLTFRPPRIPLYSAMHAGRVEAVSAEDLIAQLRAPVRFAETIAALIDDGITAMVEVGATPVLGPGIDGALALSVFRPEDPASPLRTLAALFAAGQDLHLGRLEPGDLTLPVPLPPPPMQRIHLPIALAQAQHDRASAGRTGLVRASPSRPPHTRLTDADRDLFDAHRAGGQPIAPAAWMLEQLFTDRGSPGTLRGVSITAPMSAEGSWRIHPQDGRVTLQSRGGHAFTTHLTATWTSPAPIDAPPPPRGDALVVADLYDALAAGGLTYGPTMRSLRSVRIDGDELWAELAPSAPVVVKWIDPSVLDGAFQAIVAWLSDEPPGRPFLGFAIGEVHLVRPLVGPCRAHLKLRRRHADTLRCDLTLTDALGRPCLALRDFCARRRAPRGGVSLLGLTWEPLPLPPGPSTATSRLLLAPERAELVGLEGATLVVTDEPSIAAAARSLGASRVLSGSPPPAVLRAALHSTAPVLRFIDGALCAPALTPVTAQPIEIAPGGVVWILGGAGGIGATLATHLAPGRTLILSGRRPTLSADLQARLTEVGATVHYAPLDLTDPGAVATLAAQLHAEHGRLRGVIHSAGTLTPGSGRCPKADGGAALLDALSGIPVDFLALISSLTAVVPSPGQASYAAANAALDDLVRQAPSSIARTVTINFGPWLNVGMVAGRTETLHRQGLTAMSPEEGVDAFLRALSSDAGQVIAVVLPDGDARLRAAVGEPTEPAVEALPAPVVESTPALAGDVRAVLREALALHLRRPAADLDPAATFAELGVDSLTGVELIRTLESRLSVALYPTLLFEHPVLGDFERHLRTACRTAPIPQAPIVAASGTVRCYTVGPSGALTLTTRPAAPLTPDSIRIAVGAWGVNFIDVLARVGLHPAITDAVFVPGHEVAGTVIEVGAEVSRFAVGDRVMAMPGRGGYADEVVLPARLAMPVPPGLGIEDAAGLMVTGLTAIACVEDAARVRAGESVLIQSAAGATGMACVQLALHHGATVYGTASTEAKRARLRSLGVHPIDSAEDFAAAIRRLTGTVDVIIDALAGDAISRGLSVLAPGGRFVEIGAGAAIQPGTLDPQAMFLNSQSFLGVNLSQLMKRPATLTALTDRLTAAVCEGALSPTIGHRIPFTQADDAHTLLRSRAAIGKIVLVKP